MKQTLWGPPLWDALFACANACSDANFPLLRDVLLVHLPLVLPCELCRNHFRRHLPDVHRDAGGRPRDPAHAVVWLYYLKDRVNRSLRRRSPSLEDVQQRLRFEDSRVDDVALANALVLMAISAHAQKIDDVFQAFCKALAVLLPLAEDSNLRMGLGGGIERPIVASTARVARATRIEHGLRALPRSHYEAIASED